MIDFPINCSIAGPYNGMPKKVVGMYILLADDTEPGYDQMITTQ